MTLNLNLDRTNTSASAFVISVAAQVMSSNIPSGSMSETVPLSIPRDQLYYWSNSWQEDEAETLRELGRGEGRRFENADEAIRWLLSPDE